MLDIKCTELAEVLSLEFNVEKSHCIVIGKMHRKEIAPMNLCSNNIEWCESIKYILAFIYKVASMLSSILTPPKERFMLHVTLFFCIVLELRMI